MSARKALLVICASSGRSTSALPPVPACAHIGYQCSLHHHNPFVPQARSNKDDCYH